MKIAVTSQGGETSSQVDARFGRAQCFVVVDTETGELSAHDNAQNMNASQGAGIYQFCFPDLFFPGLMVVAIED